MVVIVTFAYSIIILPCQSNLSCEEQLLIFLGYMQPILRHLDFADMIRMCVCVLGGPIVVMHVRRTPT